MHGTAPPCQSDLDVVPEVVALAQITAEDVRTYIRGMGCERGVVARSIGMLLGA